MGNEFDVEPEMHLYIHDRWRDVEPAERAMMNFVCVQSIYIDFSSDILLILQRILMQITSTK